MFDFTRLKLYNQVVHNLRFPISRNDRNPFALLYFPENGSLVDYYKRMDIYKPDAKNVIVPKSRYPLVIFKGDIIASFRDLGLYAFPIFTPNISKKSVIIDFSYYLNEFVIKLNPPSYRGRYGEFIRDYVKTIIFNLPPQYRVTMIYSVDMEKDFDENYLNRRFYAIYQELLKTPDLVDDIVFCTFEPKSRVNYRLVFKDGKYNKTRLLSFYRSMQQIKPRVSVVEDITEISETPKEEEQTENV